MVATLPAAAGETTFASAEALGAYVLEARIMTTHTPDGGQPDVSEELTRLRWQDADHWQFVRERADTLLSETRVWDGQLWTATRDRELRLGHDAEVARVGLGQQSDPWARTLGPTAAQIAYIDLGIENVENRTTHQYRLELAPSAPGARKRQEVVSVEGRVWIDEETAVRMAGDITVSTQKKGGLTTRHLRFSMSRVGGDAGVHPPPAPAAP